MSGYADMAGRLDTASLARATCIGLLSIIACARDNVPATAQSADLVLCDRVAAEPNDPDKPADVKGVATIAPSDIATAIKFCKVASGSSRRALYQLGRAYAANQQWNEAIHAFRRAADKGSTSAMVDLGAMYGTGSGVAQNPAEARKLFERAAQAGNVRAVTNLAALGGGAPVDPTEARSMLAKAAAANSAQAQFQLGLMYAEGTGGPRDDVTARSLFEKAAAQNHVAALESLGAFAQDGRGGPQDKEAAKQYYKRAIALGSESAKEALYRLECPYVLKNKAGEVYSHLCF